MHRSNFLFAIGVAATSVLRAAPIPLTNPGGEINPGTDFAAISDPAVIGWDSDGGRVINNATDYGNGGWRLSFEDSEAVWQMTDHVIAAGDSYSLRFDAAPFTGDEPAGDFDVDLTLVGGPLRNGDFNADTSAVDSRSFNDTPDWFNLGTGGQGTQATRTTLPVDGSRNAVMTQDGTKLYAVDTGHTLAAGEIFRATYQWRDASGWVDGADRIGVNLFITADDTITGARTVVQTILSALSTQNSTYEDAVALFDPIPASAAGRRLFVYFEGVNGDASTGFCRLDNFALDRGTPIMPAPVRQIAAEVYVTNAGAREVVAERTFAMKSNDDAKWDHYHFPVQAGTIDAHAGKTLGVQFRSGDAGDDRFQSVDNVRLDTWPAGAPDGSFNDDWDSTPDQVWLGGGYWANRLHDWEVRGGRVNCILGNRDRRTAHRVGTTVRGNGESFSLMVRTGAHAGTDSGNARSGFLIGAGPNLDWRAGMLVHDGLGRDFGLFAGIRTDGTAVIEDYSTNSTMQIGGGATPAGGFPAEVQLRLDAVYDDASGEYLLTIAVANSGGAVLSTGSVSVPSDRVLGSLGLLSHRGSGSAQFWFDDFTGTGAALNPEPERSLAIIGAMHTLSRGTLKLTAQLPPVDRASTSVALDLWDGGAWVENQVGTIDDTDGLSSYTVPFRVENWDGSADTDYRVRAEIGGTPHYWTGTVKREPIDKNEIVVAGTTCQRISDGSVQSNGFDWSPKRVWHPQPLAFAHIPKHEPDLFIANGDQIYEGQPSSEDSGTDFNRQHDYLYKWYLWMVQTRDLMRNVPAIVEPDDHDVFQGNLWGEGGIVGFEQNDGGYEEPASWVKLVDRTQTSHLPDTDPYHPTQPAPPVAQGIPTYFTGLVYGGIGFAVLEDRKFKTGPLDPPLDPEQQFLLGDRQKDFLRAWSTDWAGQAIKCVVSQSPLGNIHTHANSGYGFGLNDKDSHGWPVHRRNEAWGLLRRSRMFQLAGDQHLASVAHHGIEGPADAGYSFCFPAIANFFPRCWDPVHNSAGRTSTINPYKGDFFFDGSGTLPGGQPNLSAEDPAHLRLIAAANPLEYHNQTRKIDPANLHDRGAGYGIVRLDKTTRQVTFECWPLHADPEFPSTGGQFPDWPVTIAQTDNDGRTPSGYLPVIDTGWRKSPVIHVYDEADGSHVYSIRARGNLVRPPVYGNGTTYRVEIGYGDASPSEIFPGQSPVPPGPTSFVALQPAIVAGDVATLRWDAPGASSLSIDGADVMHLTVDGIGYLEVSPSSDTDYVLAVDGAAIAAATVHVLPPQAAWAATNFSPAELADPSISGDTADPDADGWSNFEEFQFQTDPRDGGSVPELDVGLVVTAGVTRVQFAAPYPLVSGQCAMVIEQSIDLESWTGLPANSFTEVSRNDSARPPRITVRADAPLPGSGPELFFRARWASE